MSASTYVSIMGPGNLSDHLTKEEVRNASHKGVTSINEELVEAFELVRKWSGGQPIKVSSAGRRHRVSGDVANSSHFDDDAFDIKMSPSQLIKLRENLKDFLNEAVMVRGLGIYWNRIHIDVQWENVKNTWRIPGTDFTTLMRHWSVGAKPWLEKVANPITYGTDQQKDEWYNDHTKEEIDSDAKEEGGNTLLYLSGGVIALLVGIWAKKRFS